MMEKTDIHVKPPSNEWTPFSALNESATWDDWVFDAVEKRDARQWHLMDDTAPWEGNGEPRPRNRAAEKRRRKPQVLPEARRRRTWMAE